jgi:hypothetical protein
MRTVIADDVASWRRVLHEDGDGEFVDPTLAQDIAPRLMDEVERLPAELVRARREAAVLEKRLTDVSLNGGECPACHNAETRAALASAEAPRGRMKGCPRWRYAAAAAFLCACAGPGATAPDEHERQPATIEPTPRDPAMVRSFRRKHPCPSTGRISGPCPGWVVDHGIPLCAGGPEDSRNMQWQPEDDARWKDAQERALCARLKACGAAAEVAR